MPTYGVDGLLDVFEDEVEIELVGFFALRVEAVLQPHDVGMRVLDELPHDLQLPVLEALVLQDLLDGDDLPRLDDGRLEDDAEGAVADDPLGGVRYGLLARAPRRAARAGGGGPGRRGVGGRGGRRRIWIWIWVWVWVCIRGCGCGGRGRVRVRGTGPGAGARRSPLVLPLLGPGQRTRRRRGRRGAGIGRSRLRRGTCRSAAARAAARSRSRRPAGPVQVGRRGMLPGDLLAVLAVT
mmetsp:Transcript_28366/g.66590  ORF Transcript_28366/g.66590 Transcript_28366/m.66590 type:complete len:238 (+) Transcript_28366:1487-2200(+)